MSHRLCYPIEQTYAENEVNKVEKYLTIVLIDKRNEVMLKCRRCPEDCKRVPDPSGLYRVIRQQRKVRIVSIPSAPACIFAFMRLQLHRDDEQIYSYMQCFRPVCFLCSSNGKATVSYPSHANDLACVVHLHVQLDGACFPPV